jgi:hypothetical protein
MATILEFRRLPTVRSQREPARAGDGAAMGAILLFTGVRYERHEPDDDDAFVFAGADQIVEEDHLSSEIETA